jgi:hypothetical protein
MGPTDLDRRMRLGQRSGIGAGTLLVSPAVL